jgi:hypothetical protein
LEKAGVETAVIDHLSGHSVPGYPKCHNKIDADTISRRAITFVLVAKRLNLASSCKNRTFEHLPDYWGV